MSESNLNQVLQGSHTTKDKRLQFVLKKVPDDNDGPPMNELSVIFTNHIGTFTIAEKGTRSKLLRWVPFRYGTDLDGFARATFSDIDAMLEFTYVLNEKLEAISPELHDRVQVALKLLPPL